MSIVIASIIILIVNQLQQLFKAYYQAFSTQNMVETLACYQLPCSLATPERIVFLANNTQAEQEFSQIFSWLEQAKVAYIEAGSASFTKINENIFMVNIYWFFLDQNKQVIADFAALYHVIKTNEQLKIFQVISHEIESSIQLPFPLTLGLTNK